MHLIKFLSTVLLLFYVVTSCPAAEGGDISFVLRDSKSIHPELLPEASVTSVRAYFSNGHTELPHSGIKKTDVLSQINTQSKEGPEAKRSKDGSHSHKYILWANSANWVYKYSSNFITDVTVCCYKDLVIFNRSLRC